MLLRTNTHTHTHTHTHTQTWTHTLQNVQPASDFHINMSSHCRFLHGFLLVSEAYITWMRWPSTMRGWGGTGGGWGGGRHYHTVCRHQCTTSIIGPVIETNHRLSVAVVQAPQIQISFRLGGKLERGELTCDPFLIFLQQFRELWWGCFIFSMGRTQTICLRCITLHPEEWLEIGHSTERRKNKPNRTLQFHGDTGRCNEVTLWLCDSPPGKVQCRLRQRSQRAPARSNSTEAGFPRPCSLLKKENFSHFPFSPCKRVSVWQTQPGCIAPV